MRRPSEETKLRSRKTSLSTKIGAISIMIFMVFFLGEKLLCAIWFSCNKYSELYSLLVSYCLIIPYIVVATAKHFKLKRIVFRIVVSFIVTGVYILLFLSMFQENIDTIVIMQESMTTGLYSFVCVLIPCSILAAIVVEVLIRVIFNKTEKKNA